MTFFKRTPQNGSFAISPLLKHIVVMRLKIHINFTVDIRRDTSRFWLCRAGAPPCRSDTDRQQMKNPLKRCFKGFCLILSLKLLDLERKTRVYPSAPHSIYQAITFAQYYTPNSRDTWVVSRCRFRVRLLPYKLQNYSCLRQIYE